jgi:hypothetical protein
MLLVFIISPVTTYLKENYSIERIGEALIETSADWPAFMLNLFSPLAPRMLLQIVNSRDMNLLL